MKDLPTIRFALCYLFLKDNISKIIQSFGIYGTFCRFITLFVQVPVVYEITTWKHMFKLLVIKILLDARMYIVLNYIDFEIGF